MRLWEFVSEHAKRWWSSFSPPDVEYETTVVLVRVGHDIIPGFDMARRYLSDVGKLQAREAAWAIRSRLGQDAPVVVLSRPGADQSYEDMAELMAAELGVDVTKRGDLTPPPGSTQLLKYRDLGGTAVMVLNGTHLGRELSKYPGPEVTLDEFGWPPHGSVHVLRIKWHVGPSTYGFPQEDSREFV